MTITNLCDNVVLCLFAGNPDIMGEDMPPMLSDKELRYSLYFFIMIYFLRGYH